MDLPQLQLPFKQKGKSTTYLANHKGSISHPIMPLVINSLGGTHTHTCIQTSQTKAISKNQACVGLWLAHAWFKKVS